jgi:tetratricopeptide (TPR) repeat protein
VVGQTARAIDIYEEVLEEFRSVKDQNGEANALGNLGSAFDEIGKFASSLEYYNQAVNIKRRLADREGLAVDLTNFGLRYISLGKPIEARRCLDEAFEVARETSHRMVEAGALWGIGSLELFHHNYRDALDVFNKSIEISDEIGSAPLQAEARYGAALASILLGDPGSARRWVEATSQYHFPLQDVHNSSLLGAVSYRLRDLNVAKQAFAAAIDQADALLAMTPELYAALDAKAIALCGLALCGNIEQKAAARAIFQAARAVTSAAGVVHKVLQLFDALAVADESHVLADIRPYAAGDSTESPSGGT